MSTTVVLFEDVDPFRELNFPITFRALIDYGSVREWTVDTYEVEGARGGWVGIDRRHALWPVVDNYATSDAGYEAIEDQIAQEIAANHDFGWPGSRGVHAQAAE